MASVTHLGTTFNTTNNAAGGSKTVTATPTAGALILIVVANNNNAGADTDAPTDDQGGTYVQLHNSFKAAAADKQAIWARTSAIPAGTSTVFTSVTAATTTGGGLSVLQVTGMSKFGAASALQVGRQTGQSGSNTPTVTLGATPQSTNPIVGSCFSGTNSSTTVTPRTGYTEHFDGGFATPNAGLEVMSLNSGETSATIAWGSAIAAASTNCSIVVELDASSSGAYSLTAAAGSFALTGQSANLRAARKLAASAGSFTLTGQSAGLLFGHKLSASLGAFTLTGNAATFRLTRGLTAVAGSFVLTGQAAVLAKGYSFSATAGSFALTGQPASLLVTRRLTAVAGSFVLSGQTAGLFKGKTMPAAAGSFALSGNAVNLRFARKFAVAAGSFILTGLAASLYKGKTLSVTPGTFTFRGYSVTLMKRFAPLGSLPRPAPVTISVSGAIPSASIANATRPPAVTFDG